MSSGFIRLITFLRVGALRQVFCAQQAFGRNMPLCPANAKA
jgi:hypothetical protein